MMMCVFVPPMPKELTPARRAPWPGHLVSLVGTKNGESAKSIFGFGFLKLRFGGISPVLTDIAALIRPATPDTVLRWPMFDLSEPNAQNCLASVADRNTWCSASTSIGSPSAVPVPCASTKPIESGVTPATAMASATTADCAVDARRGEADFHASHRC